MDDRYPIVVQVEDQEIMQILHRIRGNIPQLVLGHIQLGESLSCNRTTSINVSATGRK